MSQENNKLIAEFMGVACWHPAKNGGLTYFNSYRTTKEDCQNLICGSQFLYHGEYEPALIKMYYHESWDALMPVVEKIRALDFVIEGLQVEVKLFNSKWNASIKELDAGLMCPDINIVYKAVVDIIQSTNSQPTPK